MGDTSKLEDWLATQGRRRKTGCNGRKHLDSVDVHRILARGEVWKALDNVGS